MTSINKPYLLRDTTPSRLQELHEATLRLLALLATHKLEEDLLQKSIEALTTLIGARYGAIGILDEAGQLKQFVHTGISPEETRRIGHLPEGRGLLGTVVREDHVLRLDDMSRDPRSAGFPPNHPPMKSLLAAPISHQGRVYGRVYLSEKTGGEPFDDHDEILTKHYADALALVLAYHRSQAERAQAQEMLQEVARALSAVTGEKFFRELVLNLAQALRVDHVFIGEPVPDAPDAIRTIAYCAHGEAGDNFTYDLRGSPCENVLNKQPAYHPRGVQQLFPEDRALADLGVESYMGYPLFDSAGKPLGILVAMDSKPLLSSEPAQSILRISAARAAAELERMRSERTLRDSESRNRALLEAIPDLILRIRGDGTYLDFKPAHDFPTPVPPEMFLGKNIVDILPPEVARESLRLIRQALATGRVQTHVFQLTLNGEPRDYEARIAPAGPDEAIASIRDVTERHRAERQMRLLASAVENIADSVVITDRDGVIQYVNPAYEKVTGYSRAEAIEKQPNIVKSGKHDPAFFERLWRTILSGEVFREVFINRRKNGELYHEQKTITPLKNERGEITHFVSTGKDITERVRAEEALAQSAAEWMYAMNFIDDPICLVDLEDKVMRVNRAFYRFTGRTPETTLGRTLTSVMHPRGETVPCPVCQARKERRDACITREADDPTNPTGRPTEVTVRMIRNDAGEPTGMLVGIHDLTRTRQAGELLRESEASLAQAQRIAHLGNWDWNIVTNELRWSDEIFRIFGLTPQQFGATYEAFLNSVHPDDRQSVTEAVNKALNEKAPYGIYHRIVLPGGTERIVHEQAEVTFDENGEPIRMVGTVQDVTEFQRARERLNHLAHYDTLTGLPNRLLLQDRLNQCMFEADRRDRIVAVMFLDLDRFKIINDTLGHDVGDALLKSVAERLTTCVRAGDTISRLGGDEFTVILANVAHVDDVSRVAQKIIDSFAPPFNIAGRELFMSTSIGITLYPFDDDKLDSLLRNADAAMYHAKEMGRNTFQFYTAELNRRTAKRLQLETALRHALERNELLLHYQPQVNLKTGKIIGAEALLRWRHPEMGLIPPLDFIPLAEETGLIIPIGEWVLRHACRQAQAWRRAGFPRFQVAVNLSGRQLQHRDLAKLVKKVLKETGLNPRHLDLELTESLLMHNTGETLAAMEELHTHGVSFSMDDFGTGYSSLSYLKRFPIDTLKIDQSFVRDIPADPDDAAIAQAIIAMAHSLGIRVIAEGVETAKQFAFLRAHQCDGMQGYYFSKPVPAEAMTRLLQEDRRLPRRKTASRGKTNSRKQKSAPGARRTRRRSSG